MELNVGSTDKIVRVILGVVFILLAAWAYIAVADATFQLVAIGIFLLLAVIMFVTSFTGKCPIYAVTGLSTNK